jgi:hypothetical protein
MKEKIREEAMSGSTTISEPRARATAWSANPAKSKTTPSSHNGRLIQASQQAEAHRLAVRASSSPRGTGSATPLPYNAAAKQGEDDSQGHQGITDSRLPRQPNGRRRWIALVVSWASSWLRFRGVLASPGW